jgi:hypothetical protein
MAITSCCQLAGGLNIGSIPGCVTSVNVSSSTEITDVCNDIKTGPTVGNVSITGYASDVVFIGCPSQAGVSISWARRYDCKTGTLYFMHSGEGQSFISGEISGNSFSGGGGSHGYVSLNKKVNRSYEVINASSDGGPMSTYMRAIRTDGYGMTYSGDIFTFNTGATLEFNNFLGIGTGPLYLQNFNINFPSGGFPIASYSFLFAITD